MRRVRIRELGEALEEADAKRAAMHGLIRRITVHPDATLELEYVVQTGAEDGSATALHEVRQYPKPKKGGYRRKQGPANRP